jgi:hypothetical protein
LAGLSCILPQKRPAAVTRAVSVDRDGLVQLACSVRLDVTLPGCILTMHDAGRARARDPAQLAPPPAAAETVDDQRPALPPRPLRKRPLVRTPSPLSLADDTDRIPNPSHPGMSTLASLLAQSKALTPGAFDASPGAGSSKGGGAGIGLPALHLGLEQVEEQSRRLVGKKGRWAEDGEEGRA